MPGLVAPGAAGGCAAVQTLKRSLYSLCIHCVCLYRELWPAGLVTANKGVTCLHAPCWQCPILLTAAHKAASARPSALDKARVKPDTQRVSYLPRLTLRAPQANCLSNARVGLSLKQLHWIVSETLVSDCF